MILDAFTLALAQCGRLGATLGIPELDVLVLVSILAQPIGRALRYNYNLIMQQRIFQRMREPLALILNERPAR